MFVIVCFLFDLLILVFSSEATLKIIMSARPSVRFMVKRDFLGPNQDRGVIYSSFATYGCYHPCLNVLSLFSILNNTVFLSSVDFSFFSLFDYHFYKNTNTQLYNFNILN